MAHHVFRFANGYGASVIMAHHVYRFANGYGASVITPDPRGSDAELAVVKFHGDGPGDYSLTYDTPITGDVLRLDGPELPTVLARVASLPA